MDMGVRASVAGALMLTLLSTAALGAEALAQATSAQETTFRVFQRGVLVGSTTITLAHSEEGWRLQGTGELKGMIRPMKHGLKDLVREIFPVKHQRAHQATVAVII